MKKIVTFLISWMMMSNCFSQQNLTVIYEQDVRTSILQRNITTTIHTSLSFYGDSMSVYRISKTKKDLLTPFDLNNSKIHHSTIHYKNSNINEDVAFLYDSLIFVQHQPDNLHWQILSDTKKICGETCNKAISSNRIIAWFSPKLKTFSAPSYYYGLPGIILELKDEKYNLTLKAKFIVYDVEPIIPSKKIIQVVSSESYRSFLQSKKEKATNLQ